jgi:hypothetical protein
MFFVSSITFINFIRASSLSRIESTAFARIYLHSVSLPQSVVFIAGDAFPRSCEPRISNIDSCQEFNEWKDARQSGSSEAFERHEWKQPEMRRERERERESEKYTITKAKK